MKHIFEAYISAILLALTAFSLRADELVFGAKPVPGVEYIFTCSTRQSTTLTLRFPGTGRSNDREDSCTINISGTLIYEKGLEKASFRIGAATAVINGEKADMKRLASLTLIIDFTGKTEEFMLAGVFDEDNPTLPLPERPTVLENRLFSMVFQPPSGKGLSQYLGNDRPNAKKGEKWACKATDIISALAERGIKIKNEQIEAKAEYRGGGKVMDKEQRVVSYDAESHNIPDYDFKLGIVVFIPAEGKNRLPSKILRNAIEVVTRRLTRDDPFYHGAVIESVSTDDTTIMMLEKADFGK